MTPTFTKLAVFPHISSVSLSATESLQFHLFPSVTNIFDFRIASSIPADKYFIFSGDSGLSVSSIEYDLSNVSSPPGQNYWGIIMGN